jgi:hypothetical protein
VPRRPPQERGPVHRPDFVVSERDFGAARTVKFVHQYRDCTKP